MAPPWHAPAAVLNYPFDGEPPTTATGSQVSFLCSSISAVDAAWNLAISNSATDLGFPGLRTRYAADFYATYCSDPEGNELCFVHTVSVQPGTGLNAGRPTYAERIAAAVRPNVRYADVDAIQGNPAAELNVTLSPDGKVIEPYIVRSSGIEDWDVAAIVALLRTVFLPRDMAEFRHDWFW